MADAPWSIITTKAAKSAADHENAKADAIVDIANAVNRLLDNNPNHPTVYAVRVILGLVDDDNMEDVLRKAGITIQNTSDDAVRGLPSPGTTTTGGGKQAMFVPTFEIDGTTPANDIGPIRYDDVKTPQDRDLMPILDPTTNQLTGYKKRPPTATAPTPAASTDLPLYDKQGNKTNKTVSPADAKERLDKGILKAKLDEHDPTKIIGYQATGKIIRR